MTGKPTVTILGTGYVGLTTAALFSATGIKTFVVDPNKERLDSVRAGKSFFYEAGLDQIIAAGIKQKTLVPTSSYKESVPHSDIVISSVGTPDNPDGSSNLRYIFAAATEAAQYLRPAAVYVQKSTVPVGTGGKIKQIFSSKNMSNQYVSNPEFLREGTAVADSLWYDRIVVGGDNDQAMQKVLSLYQHVKQARDTVASLAGLTAPNQPGAGQHIKVNLESAELIKVVSNAFLALKISFANSIAQVTDKVGADIHEVMDAVGADSRIGRAYLNACRGYGGGCFPKDVSGLIAAALEQGVSLEIMRAAQDVNESMPGYIVEKLQIALGESLNNQKIAVLGLAFKAGTSDARRSPGVNLVNVLLSRGAQVSAFDPQANKEAGPMLNKGARLANTIEGALADAQAVVVATDWPEFLAYSPKDYAAKMSGTVFVDAMNCFDMQAVTDAGLLYIGVGRGPRT